MSAREMSMGQAGSGYEGQDASERVVEFEFQLPGPGRLVRASTYLEPLRKRAERAVIIGLGATALARRNLDEAIERATQAGEEAAAKPGPMASVLLSMVGRPPAQSTHKHKEATRVPVMPIADYDDLTPGEIIARLAGLSPEELRIIRDYEVRHQGREAILAAVDQHLKA